MNRARALLTIVVVALLALPGVAWAGAIARGGGTVVVAPRGSTVVVTSPSGTSNSGSGPAVLRTPRHFFFPRFGGFSHFGTPFFGGFSHFGAPFLGYGAYPTLAVSAPVASAYAAPALPDVSPPPSPSASLPPLPSVIEYETGWYQLRGDGVSTPYVWVWVPKPPPAPSAAPPPPAPPAEPPAAPPSKAPALRQSMTTDSPIYRWVDEQGGVHLTDMKESIPERYRARAQRL
jgi:hypothetical protein